jgi:aryl-alcohol dehydrogenase-like predicted oxidoreductase
MQYRRLGKTGLKVSAVSLGAWLTYGGSIEDKKLIQTIAEKALEHGINFFDNADIYAKGKAESYMADNVNDKGLSRKHVLESIDMSLERMKTDYLDIYFAHRYDPETPLEEIVEAFSDVVRSGRALYWGTSQWSAVQIAEAHTYAKANGLVSPVTEQPEYSMLHRERVEKEILPVTEAKGMGLVVWSPLAMGMLTGKYDKGIPADTRFGRDKGFVERYVTEDNAKRVKKLKKVADGLGITRAQLALAWALRQPGVSSVITGATKLAQLEDNVKAADVVLDAGVIEQIETALK